MADESEVLVLCHWNGCIKFGSDGVYYQGSNSKKISVKRKSELSRLLDGLHIITGFDKKKFKFELFGRYPVAALPNVFTYLQLPVVGDISLEMMLEVPSKYPCINYVELYLDVKPISVDVIVPAACSLPLDIRGSSSKRLRSQYLQVANADMNETRPQVKLERGIGLEIQEKAELGNSSSSTHRGGKMKDKNSGSDGMVQGVHSTTSKGNANVQGLEVSVNACSKKSVSSSAAKPRLMSSLWVEDHELRVGLCFKDRDELKKAVDWWSIRRQQKCVVQEIKKDEYKFECIRWKCKWSLCAARMEEHGLVEITKCSDQHTCSPIKPEKFNLEFVVEEIECMIRVQPTLTVAELESWWFGKFGYELETEEMKKAKEEAIRKLYGDWDQSYRLLPKLMAAFHSSNGLVVDWQYDRFPNPEFASFRGVFWAFSQSIEGFRHCKPVIVVDTKDYNNGKYPMTMMIASGFDADDCYFPLAFAVTKEVSSDSWRWFLTGIREKVTQRKGICLISSPHLDILAVINEPESRWKEPWAYHRFCLDHLSSKFDDVFENSHLKSLVEQAGWTKHLDEFEQHMETIKKEDPKARRWLDQMHPHQWALAHDNGHRYGIMTIMRENLFAVCESVWSRGLPLTAATLLLFDELRLDFQNSLSDGRTRLNRGEMYIKPVMDKLEEIRTDFVVMPLDNNAFRVTQPSQKDGWFVQLNDSTCTCREFQVNKFPCLHALAVCEKLKINPLQYVDDSYSVERLYKTYAATFNSVPEVSAWPEASEVPTLFPPVISPQLSPTIVSGKSKQITTRTIQKKRSTLLLL